MDNGKRPADEEAGSQAGAIVAKRPRTEDLALTLGGSDSSKQLGASLQRTSSLMAPIMQLVGHQAEIFSMKFSHDGKHIVSGGFDKQLYIWDVFGECRNTMIFKGHSNAVLEVEWSADDSRIYSCGADKNVCMWDAETGARLKRWAGHTNVVNGIAATRRGVYPMLASGSDDVAVKIWDPRHKAPTQTIQGKFAITTVGFNNGDPLLVFAGGIDNLVRVWDVRKQGHPVLTLDAHTDTVTGLEVSPDGSYLLTNGMDNTVRLWDIRPYAPANRNIKAFVGAQHNFEHTLLRCSWSPDGSKVSAGSSDRFVYVWETSTRRILYKLPGHKGAVNETDFHPFEPIIGSASSDKTIYLGEIRAD